VHSALFPASPAWDFCYTGKDGILTASWDENGNLVTGETLNWSNSNLTSGVYSLEAVLDADTLLLRDERSADGRAVLALFRRAADIRLSERITLTVAHTVDVPAKIQSKIADFNRRHPDVKVVLKDYKALDDVGTRDKNEGAEQLALDLTLGNAGIDLLIAGPRADSPELAVITGNQLYLDLSPFMERDPLVNRDNLFGAVLRLYAADDGGIWGLTDRLSLNTLVSSSKIVGAREGHISSWSMGEMLDLAESLPPDAALTQGLYWGPPFGTARVKDLLGAEGWGAYFDPDSGTCSFDSPEFVRLLTFLNGIPANQDAFRRTSPDGLLDQNDRAGFAALYRSGQLALETAYFPSLVSFMNLFVDFDADDWIVMGYPDSGTAAVPGNSMLILGDCAQPNLTWELLCSFVKQDIAPGAYVITIPALKSEYETAMETQRKGVTAIFADGSMRSWSDPDDAPSSSADLDRPGELFRFTPNVCDAVTALIDGAGTPLLYSVPAEVSAIVEEEISAMTAGASTPENCAKVIQSRVSIWLAEHK
jgi:ABC-type glycerol-3-phosphate transport system substrate-binding protein